MLWKEIGAAKSLPAPQFTEGETEAQRGGAETCVTDSQACPSPQFHGHRVSSGASGAVGGSVTASCLPRVTRLGGCLWGPVADMPL